MELCDLLSTYELEELLLAHDRIATTTDRSPAGTINIMQLDSFASSNNSHKHNANIVNNNVLKVSEPLVQGDNTKIIALLF